VTSLGSLQGPKRLLGHKERNLHRVVVSPKLNRLSGGIVAAPRVREMQIHVPAISGYREAARHTLAGYEY
jgi:hypothetical protein